MSEQENIRLDKLKIIKSLGINPYPSKGYNINYNIKLLLRNKNKIINNKELIIISGRIISIRNMKSSSFIDIKDYSEKKIQLYYKINNLKKKYKNNEYYINLFKKYLDIGDIILIKGNLFITKVKEYTVLVKKIILLSKCIYPIPNVKIKNNIIYDKFKNKEKRYRMRYIDLIVNKNIKKLFLIRSLIIKYIRKFLNKYNIIEVDTPILQNIPGGANAKPFITYHNKFKKYLYLRISNELYLKRLIVGGFKGVYEFSRNFRNESIDKNHNPEFTILEIYVAYKNYKWMMNFLQKLLKYICKKTFNKYTININNKIIDFSKKIKKIKLFDFINKQTNLHINEKLSLKKLIKISKILNIDINIKKKDKLIDNIFDTYCKKHIIKPRFITDYPKYMSPLAKCKNNNNYLTERFELYINGKEIANAYSELNDPIEQLYRFKQQNKKIIDKDFIKSLKIGMPPTVGIGIGIDRLIALFTNNEYIQEVILFPQMK
ncbi:lysine--tRNA ligase [Candidatus Shikimatogenerans bostrichidophilus]|uniref:lysine--tRNA ligase n=1 Tax=Candidatus Shikimatogenerans bostrichidophilus TaxID=2943807 RepID=UPI002966756B